jgi:hypothetical protein
LNELLGIAFALITVPCCDIHRILKYRGIEVREANHVMFRVTICSQDSKRQGRALSGSSKSETLPLCISQEEL